MNREDEMLGGMLLEENAKLREQLAASYTLSAERGAEMFDWKQRAEAAEARIKEAEEQEPICHLTEQWLHYEQGSSETIGAFPVYAKPIPPADVQELQKKYDALLDLAGFRKERIAELEGCLQDCEVKWNATANALVDCAEQIGARISRIAELERKLAEQQAAYAILLHRAGIEGRAEALEKLAKGEELTTLLAQAREESRKEAVPEGWQVVPKIATLEMVDAALATDDRYSSPYEAMLAASPKPPTQGEE